LKIYVAIVRLPDPVVKLLLHRIERILIMATNRSDVLARFNAFKAGDVAAMRRSIPTGDLDLDQDLRSFGSRSNDLDHKTSSNTPLNSSDLDPDGLNSKIRGEFAQLLKQDPLYLQARRMKVHPATLTNATKRMGAEWVRKQVEYVMGQPNIKFPGGYLSKILKNNPY
jgi:hypothetical protein